MATKVALNDRQETAIRVYLNDTDGKSDITLTDVVAWVEAGMPDPNSLENRIARFLNIESAEFAQHPIAGIPFGFVDTDTEAGCVYGRIESEDGTMSEETYRFSLESDAVLEWRKAIGYVGKGKRMTLDKAWEYAQTLEFPTGFVAERIVIESASADIVAGQVAKSERQRKAIEESVKEALLKAQQSEIELLRAELAALKANQS